MMNYSGRSGLWWDSRCQLVANIGESETLHFQEGGKKNTGKKNIVDS